MRVELLRTTEYVDITDHTAEFDPPHGLLSAVVFLALEVVMLIVYERWRPSHLELENLFLPFS